VPYLLQTEEGHGFRQEENRLEFYRILEAFLAKHLGGRTTTDPSVLAPLEQAK
jgi:dipeptidyl aminopeptidase/acylaminoacyl peptidase